MIMITLHCSLYLTKKGSPQFHQGKLEAVIQISCLTRMTSHALHLSLSQIYPSQTNIREVLNTQVPDLKKMISLKESNYVRTRTQW
jgi:hypothetical protein